MHSQILPLVQYATDRTQKESVYLSDEGLQPWRAIVSNTNMYTEQIHALLQNVPKMMAHDFDHAEDCMGCWTLTLALEGNSLFLHMLDSCKLCLRSRWARDKRAALKITKAIDTMLRAFPRESLMLSDSFAKMIVAVANDALQGQAQKGQGESLLLLCRTYHCWQEYY